METVLMDKNLRGRKYVLWAFQDLTSPTDPNQTGLDYVSTSDVAKRMEELFENVGWVNVENELWGLHRGAGQLFRFRNSWYPYRREEES